MNLNELLAFTIQFRNLANDLAGMANKLVSEVESMEVRLKRVEEHNRLLKEAGYNVP